MKNRNLFKTVLGIIGLSCIFAGCSGGDTTMDLDLSNYNVKFFDDFNGTELDGTKWERAPEWERQGHMPNHGFWNDSCSYVENGNLVLEVKQSGSKLISGAVRSIGKNGRELFTGTKGVYEIKFKADKGSGFWYAFWIFAQNTPEHIGNGATNGAELDCFELLPGKCNNWGNKEDRLMTTIHWDAYGDAHQMKGTDGIRVTETDPDFYNKWHVYQFVWGEDSYDCYLDGEFLWTMSGSKYGNGMCKVPGYMKITAEWGNWGGEIDPVVAAGGTKKMLVDYVKVYEKK